MRVLLDENMHVQLRHLFDEGVEAETVRYREWTSLDNGDLMRAAEADYDVFITMDRSIPHQRNLASFDLAVLLVHAPSNAYDAIAPLMPEVNRELRDVKAGTTVEVGAT
ncbi:MAG: hypothetical protein BRD45_02885 [Bacteroidetes bacterium QS_8_64_10]|jgi:hypothetical protein|nr:MAG: hypothetical protein BRD45_02885 [Bacteroidetes bacterium QS_8_64_10]